MIASAAGPKEPNTRLVLLVLSKRMMPDGSKCFPSTRLLEEETGLSRRVVMRHLKLAEESGWLRVAQRANDPDVDRPGRGWKRQQYFPRVPKQGGDVVTQRHHPEPSDAVTSRHHPEADVVTQRHRVPKAGRGNDDDIDVVTQRHHRQEVEAGRLTATTTSDQPSRTPPVTRVHEVRSQEGGPWTPRQREAAGLIRAIWHLGDESIERDGKSIGMGLEITIFEELQERYPDEDLLEALTHIRSVTEFRNDEPISLRVWEKHPNVLHDCISAGHKRAPVAEIVREATRSMK